jgi:hypothetical protein
MKTSSQPDNERFIIPGSWGRQCIRLSFDEEGGLGEGEVWKWKWLLILISSIKWMEAPKPCAILQMLLLGAVWNSLTSPERSYTDEKFRLRNREALNLAAVYLSFIYLCFLNYVTKFLKYIPKWFLTAAPRRKTVLRKSELLIFRTDPPNVIIQRKGCLLGGRHCMFHLIKIIDL